MLKYTLASIMLVSSAAMGYATVDSFCAKTAVGEALQTTVGHNMRHTPVRDQSPIKTATNSRTSAASKHRIATRIHRAMGADHSRAPLFESFESCTAYSNELPVGWTDRRSLDSDEPTDHWYGVSRMVSDYYMFPGPADGDMMISMGYSDDYKDEWLISPQFTVPAGEYQLSFYWYTVPYYLYVIDRFHVDFTTETFTEREILFNMDVMVRAEGSEWTKLYDLESDFAHLDYSELMQLDYDEMQLKVLDISQYAGQDIQVAFRYYGTDGNSIMLDAVSVDLPAASVRYMPDYSRMFFGLTSDELLRYMPYSIEFYPVNYPLRWYNITDNDDLIYQWAYSELDEKGELVYQTDNSQDVLQVTYHPDYTSTTTLTNNLYYMPQLLGQGEGTATGSYQSRSDFLQAGGTTEFLFPDGEHYKFNALPFDYLTEGFGGHLEEDTELGLWAVPVFGYNNNTDAWWEHYSYPSGADGRYAYVDGFANLIMPHEEAPMVVYGASAVAYGALYPEAELTLRVYTMDEDGYLIEEPIAQAKVYGKDVISTALSDIGYLIMNFEFDQPLVLSSEGTGYGYLIEISGYHDPQIPLFIPMQSLVPNEYEVCLGFYHHYSPMHDSLTDEMSYVAFFSDDYGRDLYTAFAIGLDAHYPWLEVYGDSDITISNQTATAILRGYYDASQYSVEAPEWLDVTLEGRYTTTVTISVNEDADTDRTAQVTITAPGVSQTLNITATAGSGITSATADSNSTHDIYNTMGVRVRTNAGPEQLRSLPAGVYICNGKKITNIK